MQSLGLAIAEDALLPILHLVGFPVGGNGFIDIALDGYALLRPVAQRIVAGQLAVVVASPALHHQQQVQMVAVLLVVGLEIVVGMGDEALQLARQQQLGHDVARVVGSIVGTGIADTDRDLVGTLGYPQLQVDGFVGLVVGFLGNHLDVAVSIVVLVDEEQAVGHGLAVIVDDDEVADARW